MKKVAVYVPCSYCGGQGVVNDWAFSTDVAVCPVCQGVGEIRVRLSDSDLALLASMAPEEDK